MIIVAVIAFILIHNNEWAKSDAAALDCPQIWLKAIAELAELFGHNTLTHTNTDRLTSMKEYMYIHVHRDRLPTP